MGCNSMCSYCIVPAVRGREQSRRPGEIVAEVTRLAARGRPGAHAARPERQLVGPRPRCPSIRTEFGELLRACDAVDGIERIRFTSPHPKDFREPVIAAIAECDAVCEHVHLPLQSGSSRILKAMRRTYTRERYLDARRRGCAPRSPTSRSAPTSSSASPARPSATSSETLEVVEEVGFDSAFTFVYSPRHGTEAAAMPDQVPHEVKIERMERLVEADAADRRARATPRASAASSRCSSRARRAPTRRCSAAARAGTRPSTSPASAAPGELVDVLIEHATSTTLRGTQHALVAVERRRQALDAMRDPRHRLVRPDRHEPRAAAACDDGHWVFGVDKRPNAVDRRRSDTLLQDLAGHYAPFRGGMNGVE